MSAPPPSQKDAQQVLRYAFDDVNGRIRVDATIAGEIGSTSATPVAVYYNEVTSVPAETLTTIQIYIATSNSILNKVDTSGTNIATYTILINDVVIDRQRTFFGGTLNTTFNFINGMVLNTGDIVKIQVMHNRPDVGDFNSTIMVS